MAVAQIKVTLADVERNTEKHLKFIEEAVKREADLIVFPELSLTGYLLGWLTPQVALSLNNDVFKRISHALKGKLAIVGGVIEERDMFYNAALVLSSDGILGVHRKVYLPTYGMFDESRYFASGRRFEKIDTPLGSMGILICEDAWHMDAYLSMADADIFVLISNNPLRIVQNDTAVEVWHRLSSLPSTFFGTPTVYANRVGVEDGIIFFGGSRIYQGSGEISAEAPLFEETLLTAEIDTHLRRAARYNSATLKEHLSRAIGTGT